MLHCDDIDYDTLREVNIPIRQIAFEAGASANAILSVSSSTNQHINVITLIRISASTRQTCKYI